MNVQLMNTCKPNQDQLQTTESIRNACEIFNMISLLLAYHSTMIWEVCPLQMVVVYVQESSDILSNHHLCPH